MITCRLSQLQICSRGLSWWKLSLATSPQLSPLWSKAVPPGKWTPGAPCLRPRVTRQQVNTELVTCKPHTLTGRVDKSGTHGFNMQGHRLAQLSSERPLRCDGC